MCIPNINIARYASVKSLQMKGRKLQSGTDCKMSYLITSEFPSVVCLI